LVPAPESRPRPNPDGVIPDNNPLSRGTAPSSSMSLRVPKSEQNSARPYPWPFQSLRQEFCGMFELLRMNCPTHSAPARKVGPCPAQFTVNTATTRRTPRSESVGLSCHETQCFPRPSQLHPLFLCWNAHLDAGPRGWGGSRPIFIWPWPQAVKQTCSPSMPLEGKRHWHPSRTGAAPFSAGGCFLGNAGSGSANARPGFFQCNTRWVLTAPRRCFRM